MDFKRLVKELRTKLIITQEELADLLGVSFASINRWETGKHEPETKQSDKHSEDIKGMKLKMCRQAKNYGTIGQAVYRRTAVSLGFEFIFLSEFSKLFGVCLIATRSVALLNSSTRQSANALFCISNILENYIYLCYKNFILKFAKEILSNE